MATVISTMETTASPDQVWSIVSDPGRFHSWVSDHQGFIGDAPSAFLVGESFGQRVKVLGLPAEIRWTVNEVAAPSRVVLRGSGPMGIGVATRYEVAPVHAGSSLTWTMEFSGGMVMAVGGQLQREVGAQQQVSLGRLKGLLEA
jgi:uncharacterized protein YndB with AHSA1/START domain